MDFQKVSAPQTQVSIVGFPADENPHKRARFGSLFNESNTTYEQSGWSTDPTVANDDTAQTAPSTCTIDINKSSLADKNLKPTHVYFIDPKKDSDTEFIPTALTVNTTKKTDQKFGVVLTEPETDGSALVSVQWTRPAGENKWPGVLMSLQDIPGTSKTQAVFAVQHATVVHIDGEAKVGHTLYYDNTA